MTVRPPRIAEGVLRIILRTPDREFILGDLAEQFRNSIYPKVGRLRASVWYWKQVVQSISPMWLRARAVPTTKSASSERSPKGQGMDSIRQDLRFATRQLRRNPGFALTVIITLSLGIGANTAIFSVVRSTLPQPLPYPASDDLVYVTTKLPRADIVATHLASKDYADLQESTTMLDVAAVSETVVISRTTTNFFDVLGVPAVLGRTFSVDDGIPVTQDDWRPLPLVLSYGVWQTWFGGDEDIIGRSVRVNATPAVIVGVMPATFAVHLPPLANIGSNIDVWWPIRADFSEGDRDARFLRVVGRVVPDTTHARVQQELDVLATRLRAEHPRHAEFGVEFDVQELHAGVVGPIRGTLVVFLGAVGFVLPISCANVANLIMARGTGREAELAVRTALGGRDLSMHPSRYRTTC